ncbi:MAG: hypothetical protein HeimC3_48620 [Candidatus Heimdallarchaeota archaeon LC_3]|nr:MAG: hypothetical protein HeimC3_48620 [Candidatus Heimdallarchaeota archaeon LC_3]
MSQKITEISQEIMIKVEAGEISQAKLTEYSQFLQEVEEKFLNHRIVVDNKYCKWFETEGPNKEQTKHFIIQFSVFSHLFLIAQLKKMINSGSLESYRASKEILVNEVGVIFRKQSQPIGISGSTSKASDEEKDLSGDPALVSTEGTVDGGVFKFAAGHFEWLLRIGKDIDLEFNDMGKRRHGTKSTLFFCDELERVYGNDDPNIGEGASFAVENWAAAGFWKQLIRGLKKFKENPENNVPKLKLAFFTWHDKVEDQHAEHTQEELAEVFFEDGFNKEKFLHGGLEMLDGVATFWDGLYEDLHLTTTVLT